MPIRCIAGVFSRTDYTAYITIYTEVTCFSCTSRFWSLSSVVVTTIGSGEKLTQTLPDSGLGVVESCLSKTAKLCQTYGVIKDEVNLKGEEPYEK